MIAIADRTEGIAQRTARLPRVELERVFLGVVSGLLSDRDRWQVERVLRERESEQTGRES